MRVNSSASFSGSGCANSTNSKPSVPAGLLSLIVAGGASCGKGPMISSIGVGERRALPQYSAKPHATVLAIAALEMIDLMHVLCIRWRIDDVAAQIDQFDRKILALLQDDARLTNSDLSERVNLSPSQCSRRRQRLEEDGFIRGYAPCSTATGSASRWSTWSR